jgi:predicted NAD-dependent protein-ADP-ribosyltransferase YbiA (DUF1768 family)
MQEHNSKPLYFWRETDPYTGYLSQWYDCPFKDDEVTKTYKTAEQYVWAIRIVADIHFAKHQQLHDAPQSPSLPRRSNRA